MPKRYASLAEFLKRTKTKQEDFAQKVGISQPHLSKIASGAVRPGFGLAMRIAKEARIPVESLDREVRA